MATLSQLSCAGSEDSALFQSDWVPYENEMRETFIPGDGYKIEPWPAPPVTAAESSSPTTQSLHGPELVDCLTLLALQIKQNNELMAQLIQTQKELALAIREDGQEEDEEEQPSRYLDGSKV